MAKTLQFIQRRLQISNGNGFLHQYVKIINVDGCHRLPFFGIAILVTSDSDPSYKALIP